MADKATDCCINLVGGYDIASFIKPVEMRTITNIERTDDFIPHGLYRFFANKCTGNGQQLFLWWNLCC